MSESGWSLAAVVEIPDRREALLAGDHEADLGGSLEVFAVCAGGLEGIKALHLPRLVERIGHSRDHHLPLDFLKFNRDGAIHIRRMTGPFLAYDSLRVRPLAQK